MNSFLSYKKTKIVEDAVVFTLVETTVPEELQYLSSNWDHHSKVSDETKDKMISAMGVGKSFTHFPLQSQNINDVDSDVADHLTKHNYKIKDYAKGIATTKKMVGDPERGIPMREKHVDEKIGSVLEKTNAHDDVKKAYINDPSRSSNKSFSTGGHHVVITHSPLGISGMSTGTNWKNQSCMNQEDGSMCKRLEDDSENGTHVAYLVHHNDKEAFSHGTPSNPIARIALKPYHEDEEKNGGDTIFRPETKAYGAGSTNFSGAVSDWATKHYPGKEGVEYHKNDHVYDDTGNTKYKVHDKIDVTKAIDSGSNIVDKAGDSMDKSIIDHAIDHAKNTVFSNDSKESKQNTLENLSHIGNLNTQHVSTLNKIAKENGLTNWGMSIHHGDKFSTSAINDYFEKYKENIPNRMLMNPKLPEHVVDSLPTNRYVNVRHSLIKPHHIDKVVDNYVNGGTGSYYDLNDHSKRFTKEHLDKLVDHSVKESKTSANHIIMNHPEFNQGIHDKMVSLGASSTHANFRANHGLITDSKFSTIADAKKLNIKIGNLAENPHISSDISKELKNHFVKNSSLVDGNDNREISGFSRGVSVPTSMSKHMTPDDYKSLAASGKDINFDSPEHSEKHLNAIHDLVKNAHDKLDDHESALEDDHDGKMDANESEIKSEQLEGNLHKHIANYANNIETHIGKHVQAEGYGGYIKNHDEAENAEEHITNINSLHRYRDTEKGREHHSDYVGQLEDKMSRLHRDTENRDNENDY
jgi:hypothetical protein